MGGLPVAVLYATDDTTNETYATQLSFSFDVPLVYNLSSTNFEAEGSAMLTLSGWNFGTADMSNRVMIGQTAGQGQVNPPLKPETAMVRCTLHRTPFTLHPNPEP